MPCRGLRFVLSVVFYVVNENPQNRIRLKSCKKQKKTPETIGFQVLFGAAGRIRTADLILTNGIFTVMSHCGMAWKARNCKAFPISTFEKLATVLSRFELLVAKK